MKGKKVIAIIQARMDSKRLPGKVLMSLADRSILSWVIDRVKAANCIDEIWVATTTKQNDIPVVREAKINKVSSYQGSEGNVFSRFCQIANDRESDIIVRITADNPFTYFKFIDKAVWCLVENKNIDYVTFTNNPLGTGVEAFCSSILFHLKDIELNELEKEHVTLFVKNRSSEYKISELEPEKKLKRPELRLTIDTEEDYQLANALFYFLGKNTLDLNDIVDLLDAQPWLTYINKNICQKTF